MVKRWSWIIDKESFLHCFLGEKEDGVSDDKVITNEHATEHNEENEITSATKDVSWCRVMLVYNSTNHYFT